MTKIHDAYYNTRLTTIVCGDCGIPFGVPDRFDEARRETGGNFYCPNGHSRMYRKTDVQALKEKLAASEKRAELRLERAEREKRMREAEERSHIATKGHLTRQKKRAAAGVCPCCQRTFKQLARHMKSQHPDYVKEHAK